jgi:hypothetical protein
MKIVTYSSPKTFASNGSGILDHYTIVAPHDSEDFGNLAEFWNRFQIEKAYATCVAMTSSRTPVQLPLAVLTKQTDNTVASPTYKGTATVQDLLSKGGQLINLSNGRIVKIPVKVSKETFALDTSEGAAESITDKIQLDVNAPDILPVSTNILVVYFEWHLKLLK